MRAKQKLTPELVDLAARHAGVLTLAQCHEAGLTRSALRRLTSEGWTPIGHRLLATSPPTFRSWCWAALLIGSSRAVIGGLAGAHLWGLRSKEPENITVFDPVQCRTQIERVTFVRAERPGVRELTISTPAVTLVDAAAECDEAGVVDLVTAAHRMWPTIDPLIREVLEQRDRVVHRALLRDLTTERDPGLESALEVRFVRDVLRAHGLPLGTAQRWVGRQDRHDRAYDDYGVLVELDGQLGHADAPFRDMARDNRAALRGYRATLRYGWHDTASQPCAVAEQLAQMLGQHGWQGQLVPCPRCREHRDEPG